MKFWRKRKQPAKSHKPQLCLERLEERAMMAVIPLASGETARFYDADGTEVKVKLLGPGSGTIELVGGVTSGASIDTLSLAGTTGATTLKISTRGGSVAGTTINDVVIDNAVGQLDALKLFKGKHVTITGDFTADGSINDFCVRSLGNGANVNVSGDVGRFKADNLANNAQLEVAGTLREFVAKLLAAGSSVEANQLDMLKVKQQAVGANFNVGEGGLTRAKLGWIYDSNFQVEGAIGDVVVKGNAMGTGFSSNIDKGSDGVLGTIDDFVIDPSSTGYIQRVKFGRAIGTTGTQQVKLVSSGQVGEVKLSHAMAAEGATPMIWQQVGSSYTPLNIIQSSLNATGYSDDEIYIAVFGEQLAPGAVTGTTYYLSPSGTAGTLGVLTTTAGLNPSTSTPNLVTLPSYALSAWVDTTQAWGSDLNFPTPPPNEEWSGRILISVGAPVQAQINANGTVAAPSASDPIDPSTGSFYDFLEFTVTANSTGTSASLDIDTSLVDAFGLPMALQLFQQSPTSFTGTLAASSNTITAIPSTTGLAVGQTVIGQGIPLGATITQITASTISTPDSIVISKNTLPSASGSQFLVAANSFDVSIQGTINPNSNVITGINTDTFQGYVLNSNVGTSQPISAANVLPEGTTIASYSIGTPGQNDTTITLTKLSDSSVTPASNVQFTISPAGAVGVKATRQDIMGSGANSLLAFLQQEINSGNTQALPFLQSAYPSLLSGPVPISGVVPSLGAIEVETTGTSVINNGDLVQISGVLGNTVANGYYAIASTTDTSFTIDYPISNGAYTGGGTVSVIEPEIVTAATTSAAVIGTSSVGTLAANQIVTISGAAGNTAINGNFVVASVGTGNFTLGGPTSTGTYAAGTGYWYLPNAATTAVSGMTFVDAPALITTSTVGNLAINDVVTISGVQGATNLNGGFVVASVTPNSFTIGGPVGNAAYTSGGTWSSGSAQGSVTAATNNNAAIVITTTSTTGMDVGDEVTISGVLGNTAANGTFLIESLTATTFTLGSPVGQTYTSGGSWQTNTISATNITDASEQGFSIATPNTDNLVAGDLVLISDVTGLTGANGAFIVASVEADSFTVYGATGTGAYASGGNWQIVQDITNATSNGSTAIQIATDTPGLASNTVVQIAGVEGVAEANGMFIATSVSGAGFTLGSPVSTSTYTGNGTWQIGNGPTTGITYATNGGEITLTTNAALTGLTDGDWVVVSGVAGNSAANGSFKARDVSGSTFTLEGSVGTGTYTYGGIVYEYPSTSLQINDVSGPGIAQMTVTADTTTLSSMSTVLIQGVIGNTAANGIFLIENVVVDALHPDQGTFQIGAPVGNGNYNENTWSIAVTGAATKPAYVVLDNATGLNSGDDITIQDATGNTSINGTYYVADLTGSTVTLGGPTYQNPYTSGGYWTLPDSSQSIVSGSSATGQPVVITTDSTFGLTNGDSVLISGATGNSSINGLQIVSNVTNTSFTIAAVNGNGTAISGGSWQPVESITSTSAAPTTNAIVVHSNNTDGVNVGGVISISGVDNANGTFVVADVNTSTNEITLGSPAGSAAYNAGSASWTGSAGGSGHITGATNGGWIEIYASNTTGLNDGDLVQITGIAGNTAANGVYIITDVKSTSFTLTNALSNGTYSFGGTWKEFGAIPRLVSPKDLVESLASPQDEGELNNYFNELIDDFFLNYLPSSQSVNGHAGGGQTLQLTSTASGSPVTYSGTVTNVGTANGGYVLRFTSGGSSPTEFDPDTLDIYYPFFTSNAPSPDVYTPLFGVEEPPSWLVDLNKQNESATQMLFACDAIFADNTARAVLGMSATAAKVIADLENLVSGAFNRGIALNPGDTWSDYTTWFPENGVYNYWVEYWHQSGLTYGDLAYAFAYDDKFGASTNLQIGNVGLTQITLGGWGDGMTATTTSVALTLPNPITQPVNQNQSITLTATVTGATNKGTVTFFVNGIPITTGNDSNTAPLDPISVTGGTATLTANLPTLPDGNNYNTYSVTAVYSGHGNLLPSIGTTTIEVNS